MWGASLPHAAFLACIAITSLAGPIISPPITARNVDASSPPLMPAGPQLEKHSLQTTEQPFTLSPRAPVKYAVPGTSVYIMIEIGARVVTSTGIMSITNMLNGAFRQIARMEIDLGLETLIAGGMFKYGNGPQIVVWNANNHQVTIMTLQLALEGVFRYMREKYNYGVAEFDIFDGANQVGRGHLVMYMEKRDEGGGDDDEDDDGLPEDDLALTTNELGRRADEPARVDVFGTKRYILIGVTAQVVDQTRIENLYHMLHSAWMQADMLGREHGWANLVWGGLFVWGIIPKVNVWNANNHQVSYVVLRDALGAVMKYMQDNNIYGAADFSIFDGDNKVGEGVVSGS